MTDLRIEVTSAPAQSDLETISTRLSAYNDSDVGTSNRRPLAVFVRNDTGTLVAGISGYTAWGWLYVQWLWIAEDQRGKGLAGRMLAGAEDEAMRRGCHGSYIDTFNPVALKVYQRAGYAAFGALEDFPKGRTRTFLQKRF